MQRRNRYPFVPSHSIYQRAGLTFSRRHSQLLSFHLHERRPHPREHDPSTPPQRSPHSLRRLQKYIPKTPSFPISLPMLMYYYQSPTPSSQNSSSASRPTAKSLPKKLSSPVAKRSSPTSRFCPENSPRNTSYGRWLVGMVWTSDVSPKRRSGTIWCGAFTLESGWESYEWMESGMA